ncbi:MAG: MFS transporter [Alphaproteobacteria bacterium]
MLIYGTLIGSYLPYLPFVKDRFGIGESAFSMGFLLGAIGALASLPLAPWVIKKVGTRKAALVMSVFYLSTVGFMMSAPSFALFLVLFLLVGLTISTWEIAVNSQASAIEDQMGKPVISSIHGFWSLGTFIGSAAMAGWLALELNGLWLIWSLIVLGFLALPRVYAGLLRREQIPAESATESPPLRLKYVFYPPLMAIAFYMIAGYMLEGTFQDWGSFLIRELMLGRGAEIVPERLWSTLPAAEADLRRSAAVSGGIALAFFTAMMTVGRLAGDTMITRFGRAGTLQIGGVIAVIGIVLATMEERSVLTYIGFALVGLGTANIIPQVIKTADSTPGLPPGVAISIITAVGFIAFLGGPVTVGFTGEHYGFRITFLALAIFPLVMAVTAGLLLRWFERGRERAKNASD